MDNVNGMKRLLIIEDEKAISDLLAYSLKKEGFEVDAAYDGRSGLNKVGEVQPDLIILDLMLPDMNGFEICKELSYSGAIPIMILTAKADIVDKVIGFELGAFDYITKPFDMREVIARVKALLRRKEQADGFKARDCSIKHHNLSVSLNERKVMCKGTTVELTPKEYDLLVFMLENKGTVFTREKLLDSVWGFDYIGDSRTVDIHIVRLRKKLDERGTASIIETVFGVGYKLVK